MKTVGSGILGILTAVLSGVFVFSILSLAVVEGMITIPPTATIRPTLLPPNLTPIADARLTPTALLMQTSTQPPQPTQCPPPDGWRPYIVQPGDNLADLAAAHGLSLVELMEANCLISSQLVANASIYLPPTPTDTPTATPLITPTTCVPPRGWILYTIRPGDTLSTISQRFQISLSLLMEANCLMNESIIAGKTLWVPNVPTITPDLSPTFTLTHTQPPPQPTRTFTPTPTQTPTTPTDTSTPTPTQTLTTPTETSTPTGTPTPTVTITPTPSDTSTATPTDTPTTSTSASPTSTFTETEMNH